MCLIYAMKHLLYVSEKCEFFNYVPHLIVIFICPYIFSIIRNWWPTRCKLCIYLYPISSTYFGRCFRPSSGALDCIYNFWYSPIMLLPAGVMDEMEGQFRLFHDTGRRKYPWTIPEAVNKIKCSWWWAKTSPETCRADWVQINKSKIYILLIISYELYFISLKILYVNQKKGNRRKEWALKMDVISSSEKLSLPWQQNAVLQHPSWGRICMTLWKIQLIQFLIYRYEGHLESKERFAIKKYLLIIGKKKNMQVLSHTFTYFST